MLKIVARKLIDSGSQIKRFNKPKITSFRYVAVLIPLAFSRRITLNWCLLIKNDLNARTVVRTFYLLAYIVLTSVTTIG